MNWYRQVHKLQVDMTSHCNARCGACIRNIDGGQTKPGLELTHFDVDVWKRMATVDTKGWWVRQLSLNGNWGDPMMHPHLVEMLEIWISVHPESFISIATNGSMRSTKFWSDLAIVLRKGSHHKVDFAVDGMEDTHHIYRRKTVFSKLKENIEAFTSSKGNAVVQMTMFEHNKHQINEVKELAKELGCKQFNARRSHSEYMEIKDGDEQYNINAWYPTGNGEFLIDNKEPELNEYFEENDWPLTDMRDNIWLRANERFEELNLNYIKSKCPWKDEGEVQIDPWGVVWPCCHISLYGGDNASSGMSIEKDFNKEAADIDFINRGRRMNSLHSNSLKDILNNEWFNDTLNNAIDNADYHICRRNCGICK
jgi:MoaA/NifB/PqqE/SkfB family radical SAM enzyme